MIPKNGNARIHVVFTSSGLFRNDESYLSQHPDRKVLTNEEILNEIHTRSRGVEFVGGTEAQKPRLAVAEIEAHRQRLDGVLWFGSLPEELIRLDMPVVAVHPLWGQLPQPFNSYRGCRVLTASLPVIPDRSAERFSARLDAIAQKIRPLQAVARMKNLKALCVTDTPTLGLFEPTKPQLATYGRQAYESRYLENLHTLGAEIIVRPQAEMVARLQEVSTGEANGIAESWIAESEGMQDTNENEVRQSAKLYLAIKSMMDEHGANAVATEGYGEFIKYPDGPIPSQGLASSQFCTDGVPAVSETLIDCLATQHLGLGFTASAGFAGNYILDPENGKAYLGHCECPFNPYGGDRRAPYFIRNLPPWLGGQRQARGACVQVKLPENETVTVAKLTVHDKKLSLFTGRTVSGDELFPGWDDILSRTKLAIDADALKLFQNLDWLTFGHHRVAFFGDYREHFKNAAILMGYEVVEKDR